MSTLQLYHKRVERRGRVKRGELMDAVRGGQRLKALREKAGLTQDQLAKKAGINRLVVVRIETGATAAPTFEAAVLIGRALRLSPTQVAELFEI